MAAELGITLAGLMAAAGAAVTSWRAADNEIRAETDHPPEGRMLDVGGTRVHVVEMGAGPDLVLIHGASGNTRDMSFALAPALAQSYRVLIFDRPGLGYSQDINPKGATINQQAELLMRACGLLGASRPIVMGQSYGGAVALAWAVHHPETLSALVPVAAASHPWDTPLDPFYRITSSRLGSAIAVPLITAFTSEAKVKAALEGVFAPQLVPEGYASHFGPGLTLRRSSLRANALQRANLLDEIIELAARYDEISVPTEILHGTRDETVNFNLHSVNLANRISGAVLTPLEGIGHMPQHVAVRDVVAAIDRAADRAGLR
ncbi:alpha/beta fold hydrolase [Primorskyibacter sp. S87]|uniref:alpha/beta fold hydrolase n=1 Tax=Primorskyibacter sp. S87 TaxID=3415126 RepID=UPI003C797D15